MLSFWNKRECSRENLAELVFCEFPAVFFFFWVGSWFLFVFAREQCYEGYLVRCDLERVSDERIFIFGILIVKALESCFLY